MSNNLLKMERNLKSIVKRYKTVKYSLGLAILFLMMGTNAFTEEIATRQTIQNSVGSLQTKINTLRSENEKQLKGLRLELVQLMEQGDQVIKSPWSSWQFGMGYTYSKWGGKYKGKGDKEKETLNIFKGESVLSKYVKSDLSSTVYGTTELDLESIYEPNAEITVSAAVKIKNVAKRTPDIHLQTVNTPSAPQLNISLPSPEGITQPNINSPAINRKVIKPNLDFFHEFLHSYYGPVGWNNTKVYREDSGKKYFIVQTYTDIEGIFWSGVDGGSVLPDKDKVVKTISGAKDVKIEGIAQADFSDNVRRSNIIGIRNPTHSDSVNPTRKIEGKNIVLYIAGGEPLYGANDIYGFGHLPRRGGAGIYIEGDAKFGDMTFNLYGKAAAISILGIGGPRVELSNFTVNLYKDYNTIFNLIGSATGLESNNFYGRRFAGISSYIKGNVNVNLKTKKNLVYGVGSYMSTYKFMNSGKIKVDGASNTIFFIGSYSPNPTKYLTDNASYGDTNKIPIKHAKETDLNAFIPLIQTNNHIEQYGDENVVVIFNKSRIGEGDLVKNHAPMGIYQGEIDIKAKIGEYLSSDANATEQIEDGNLTSNGYSNKFVEGNVGIYADSGQRKGLKPHEHLGANTYHNKDAIHNLEIGKFDIKFGKYSKQGFMFLTKLGTVIDVGKSTTTVHIGNTSTDFTDGLTGADTDDRKSGLKSVIAYSEGVFANNAFKLGITTGLEGKSSEIIVHIPLTMTSREGIAYFGDNKGKVTVNANTEATGRKSIIALANKGGEVNITGTVNAKDRGVSAIDAKVEKYKNIGAYAKAENGENSLITINGNIDINGIGALADGEGSKISLKGNTNKIYTGTDGGLVAKSGGEIEFHGGTIVNKNNSVDRGLTDNDHKNTTPFYATDKNGIIPQGKISFKTNDTNIEIYDGILVFGKASDYASASSPNPLAKYQGMEKVKVKLMGDGVNLGVFDGLNNVVWAGNSSLTTYTNGLLTIPKFGALDPNGKSFKSTLTGGTLTINSDVNLTDSSDKFNGISMEKELVTINSGKTITGNGKGLSMGSNNSATSNLISGYINKGNVNITGGTLTSGVAGINVSYGYISNLGDVKVDNGAGLYGTNGSKLENKGNILLSGSGQGIAGISKKASVTYGTDAVEIINDGKITIIGNNSTGIYAENNTNTAHNNINIKNNNEINVGDNGVGIALKSTNGSTVGGLISVNGTGNSDIVTGKNGIGIYAENSKITLNSDYGIETKDNGVGIYTIGNSTVGNNKTLKYTYSGSSNGNGIATLYLGTNSENNLHIKLNNSTNSSGGLVGVFAKGGGNFVNSGNIAGTSRAAEFGIVTENASVNNTGNIILGDADNLMKGNVGIFVKNSLSGITNTGSITAGKNSIGLYGYAINHTIGNIKVGDNGIAVYSQGGNVSLTSGSIEVGKNEAVGVFTTGIGQNITSSNTMLIDKSSYGLVMKGEGYNLLAQNPDTILKGDSVFAYSDIAGKIENQTKLSSNGSGNYGLYSAGIIENKADINFGTGTGNVGIYSISYTDSTGKEVAGKAVNGVAGLPLTAQPKITVGETNTTAKLYGIGMAAGYADEDTGIVKRIGQIENLGTIDVFNENSIGMYAVGSGSKAINRGVINLSGKKTVGMYLDQNAIGENYGTIRTVPNPTNDGIIGVVALNGAILKNYGQIIIDSSNGIGFYSAGGGKYEEYTGGSITANGTDSRAKEIAARNNTGKEVKGIKIIALPGSTNATIIRDGQIVSTMPIDTNIASANATQVQVGSTILDLSSIKIPSVNLGQASSIGMYIDTSGINYTNPIQGLENITGLKKVNLMVGTEASLYTNAKDIEIGQNILKPYNDTITQVSSSGSGNVKWIVNSAGLTWIATVTQNPDFTISKMYLSKIPYTSFAKDKDTHSFMEGLEEHYNKASGKDKEIFNKINALGKQEGQIFAQAVDEMKGKQYANIQQRINTTGNILDKEFKNLRADRNMSKDSNKIKTFGAKGEYKTDTAGISDYKYNAYGVAYVHESEDVKLGKDIGWYTGIVQNKFKFKDIGNSKEEQLQTKLGLFKSRPYDDNNSLNWTTSGEIFIGYNRMDRKFLVVDEIYQAKSKYYTYGIGVRNEISKEFRLSEDFRLKSYAALKLEYGRVSKIKEKNGEIKLEIKSNDYVSIKPEIGTELSYRHYFGDKTLNTSIGMSYENELGKVANGKNKAKVADTNGDWFNIRGEKEDRKGNVKFDLNLGFDNQRYGIIGNIGYDTKGSNIRGGLGIKVIF
ncbi:autotransporter-associated N-terminal domain-containing protein [Fusobacterium canifelinum]|nr:autotransporter-associated N-terminal domain-containing protein [Fusobacterium canifelinum]